MAPSTEQWMCADRSCNTGQTSLDRTKYGRKVVSDFFGRNKRETKEIDADVWHMMCRKSYQRNKYNAEKGGAKTLSEFYIEHIKSQLDRIRLWRPDATFTVQLEKPAKERLNAYHDILRRNGGKKSEAEQQIAVQQKTGTKGKPKPLTLVEAVKVEHAEHIDANFSGNDKTLDDLATIVMPWIEGEVESGSMMAMPPIEFLLNKVADGERVINPKTNYERWVAHVDGVPFDDEQTTTPSPKKVKKLVLKVSPRPPIFLSLKKRASTAANPPSSPSSSGRAGASSDLPLYQPPPPLSETSRKRKRQPAEDLPLYVPPPPVKKRAASVPASPATPGSDFTLVDVPPLMRRGMVYGGGTKMYVHRSELDDDDESEFECESSPLGKKSKA